MAVPHYTYLVLKMLGPKGIITVKGSFELSDLCDKEFHKMAQNFSMMASYGEPDCKAKSATTEDTAARTKPQGARSKETSGTATRTREDYRRTREDYRRRREDSSNIGEKAYKLVE
jgi:hypothetical protein